MPLIINIESALLQWQARHNQRMTYEELAERAGITIAALYRIKSGKTITPDLRKINAICKVLECEPGDLFIRQDTGDLEEETLIRAEQEHERQQILDEFEEKAAKATKANKTS